MSLGRFSFFCGENKMKKYLISDLDHTLLHENGQLDSYTIDVVRHSPVNFSLASARNPLSMIDFVKSLGLTGPQLALNGSLIFRVTDGQIQSIQEIRIPTNVALKMQHFMKEYYPQINFTWITKSHWYVPEIDHQMRIEMSYSNVKPLVENDLKQTAAPMQIVLIIKDSQLFQEIQNRLRHEFAKYQLNIHSSGDGYLTINGHGANKSAIVNYLLNEGVLKRQIYAVGDDENDLKMLDAAGHSLGVKNARLSVLDRVDQVLASNEDNGVAHFLKQI